MNEGGTRKVRVIPCSGIGKVLGLMTREAALGVTETLLPECTETVCLALLVTGDPEAVRKVREGPCITVDGCPKMCAMKNVERSGGTVALGVRAHDAVKRHRGGQFGTPTELTADGWVVVDEMAAEIAERARGLLSEEVSHG